MSTIATAAPPVHSRGLGLRTLAWVAPAPFVALAIANAVNPADLGGSAAQEVASFSAHGTAASVSIAFSALFVITLVPATIAMLVATRERAGRGTAIITGYWVIAACFGATAPAPEVISWLTAHYHLSTSVGIAMNKALEGSALYAVGILPFALAITLGRIALGVVLWRLQIAPRWMAGCLLVAVPVEWGGAAAVGNAGPAVAYVLTAIGFASASLALLRSTNERTA
ncbi:hypothetical protein [Nocardioides marmorisolisilvae]|uniref:DUF4386 family protein n=1 Tax=Nocardioides marmorisolisilvae TaxID=1542737 RepID=A0A3N0DXH8_9ACTN|nr:hypothetical protein [Nocardioides marmorisolisilvae]RNL80261.1 hypothetical protein EFL95_15310 [Nocardioides marmorisolisilvae]